MDEQQWIDECARIAPDLEAFFLGRLASLLVRQMTAASLAEREALGRAILCTFFHCLDLGFEEQAYALLEQLREAKDLVSELAA